MTVLGFSLSLFLKSTGDKIGMAGACKLGDAVTQFPSADMPVHRGHIAYASIVEGSGCEDRPWYCIPDPCWPTRCHCSMCDSTLDTGTHQTPFHRLDIRSCMQNKLVESYFTHYFVPDIVVHLPYNVG